MATKTITIKEDVYRMLVSLKRNNESFSTLFERLAKSSSNINKLKALRGFVEIDDKEMLLKEISEKRKEIRY
ncbi:MAG TPA: hypothetical protein C5S50_00765 [Methanosarcinaceae archaeon]|nr:hypothetical protein [Methanosarcinaceae archaeon]